ncbi:short-chain dehydrogenase/reductase-like protein [Dothidotthia symphoricarpi CBS 119687]|uniref:Short-chain dehydrogenase/reductase-like protein n=1 Tax=Dothidotthia symphoricarpi CBS 119687 TaxID=1392245 RepID=A0A6A6A9P6_9PLEO|nr:short-chain dehydrogenase/reductase-like protein [Dothidotthia symphoricarpi CBS 119687]KAF2127804.1 short-chain dehydrogenase/reductase-like protein [Dothidotthia symphoricarpi CBS 119687]
MPGRLANKIAVITGSSSGIGRATALAFAREGASIVCSDIREEARTEYRTDSSDLTTVQEAEKLGAKAIYLKCDTTSSSDVEALVNKAVEQFGRVDIFVNNAGIAMEAGTHGHRPIWEFEEDAFDKTLDINVKGVFYGLKFASRQMKDQTPHPNGDRGWIINLASVFGLGGGPGTAAYITSKHAVMGLTRSAAWDCAPHRIHVNALCPGYTQTSFLANLLTPEAAGVIKEIEAKHPFRGLGTPDDIARAAVFLASEDAAWITGIGLPVDGGYSSV